MAAPKILTEADYFAADHASDSKLDFIDGKIIDSRALVYAMAGGALEHSAVSSNIIGELRQRLKGKPCRVHGSELRVAMPRGNYVYPDALVYCGEPVLREEGPSDTLMNPLAVYEVLSPSTEKTDRGPKLDDYMATPSIQEIVLVRPDAARVERYIRDEAGWRWEATVGLGATLRTVGVEIPMAEVYAGVTLPEGETP